MIKLFIRPPFFDEWTELTIVGDHEGAVANIAVSHLLMSRHEVEVLDESGAQIPFGDWDQGSCDE